MVLKFGVFLKFVGKLFFLFKFLKEEKGKILVILKFLKDIKSEKIFGSIVVF